MSRLTKVTSKSQGPLLGLGTPGPALGALQSQARLRLGASFLEEQGMGDSEACPPQLPPRLSTHSGGASEGPVSPLRGHHMCPCPRVPTVCAPLCACVDLCLQRQRASPSLSSPRTSRDSPPSKCMTSLSKSHKNSQPSLTRKYSLKIKDAKIDRISRTWMSCGQRENLTTRSWKPME